MKAKQISHFCAPSHPHANKRVRFTTLSPTDIRAALVEQLEFRLLREQTAHHHCRPILKHSSEMTGYIRRAGGEFARALAALGTWCSGVTSPKANVRSDMYRQLVAQIRGTSAHLRHAGESVLQANIHGMWVQLVDDFSIQREDFTPADQILYCQSCIVLI
jgi:hypothetical protein